jgi:hypothetical protein
MTEAGSHDHGTPAPAGAAHGTASQPYFSDADWKAFQEDDVRSARAIVCLMGAVFVTGLLMYLAIAYFVGS